MEESEEPGPADGSVRVGSATIPLKIFDTAIRAGQLAADFCTKSHPRTYPGMAAWAETVAMFRQSLGAEGWVFSDEENIPCVSSLDGSVTITCISGNDGTGLREKSPGPNRSRGPAGIRIVRQNQVQIEMMALLPEGERGDPIAIRGGTWFLLYHRDGDLVRNELSLAHSVSADGALVQWQVRQILPVINLNEGDGGSGGPGGGSAIIPVPDLDVPVERLAG